MKLTEKQEAKKLRLEGMSIGEIAKKLNIAKSTVHSWVSKIVLTKKQFNKIQTKNPASKTFLGNRSSDSTSKRARDTRLNFQKIGKLEIGKISLHLMGCMLYWGEGAKDKNAVRLTNYDPEILKIFIKFLRECYQITNDLIKIYVISYSKETVDENESFWTDFLELPKSSLGKSFIVKSKENSKNIKFHEHGGCRIEVYRTEIVQRIFGSIKQYTNIKNENLWLD